MQHPLLASNPNFQDLTDRVFIISDQIPLPPLLYGHHTFLAPIFAEISNISSHTSIATLSLTSFSRNELTSAFNHFLTTWPARCQNAPFQLTLLNRLESRMRCLEWRIETSRIPALQPQEKLKMREDAEASIMALFLPSLDDNCGNFWEIPWVVPAGEGKVFWDGKDERVWDRVRAWMSGSSERRSGLGAMVLPGIPRAIPSPQTRQQCLISPRSLTESPFITPSRSDRRPQSRPRPAGIAETASGAKTTTRNLSRSPKKVELRIGENFRAYIQPSYGSPTPEPETETEPESPTTILASPVEERRISFTPKAPSPQDQLPTPVTSPFQPAFVLPGTYIRQPVPRLGMFSTAMEHVGLPQWVCGTGEEHIRRNREGEKEWERVV